MSAMVKIDVSDGSNWMDVSKVDVGFAAERQLVKTNLASDRQRPDFPSACPGVLAATVKKILEKAPIIFPLARLLSWMDPMLIVQKEEREHNKTKLHRTLSIMCEAGRVHESSCDQILTEYLRPVDTLQEDGEKRDKFKKFCPGEDGDRVDRLLYSCLADDKDFADLWKVVKQLSLLSHGQASVERGFSVNKKLACENLGKKSLVAHCGTCQEGCWGGACCCCLLHLQLDSNTTSTWRRRKKVKLLKG